MMMTKPSIVTSRWKVAWSLPGGLLGSEVSEVTLTARRNFGRWLLPPLGVDETKDGFTLLDAGDGVILPSNYQSFKSASPTRELKQRKLLVQQCYMLLHCCAKNCSFLIASRGVLIYTIKIWTTAPRLNLITRILSIGKFHYRVLYWMNQRKFLLRKRQTPWSNSFPHKLWCLVLPFHVATFCCRQKTRWCMLAFAGPNNDLNHAKQFVQHLEIRSSFTEILQHEPCKLESIEEWRLRMTWRTG